MPRQSACRLLPGRFSDRGKGPLLLLILTVMFFFAPLSRAQDTDDSGSSDSHVRIVRISYVDGEVRMDSGHGFENVTMNVPVTERNWLQTQSDGWAEVQFEDGSLLRLAPDSRIIFTQLSRSASGATITTVDLDQGEAEFKVTQHDDGDFQVTVKNKSIGLVHSGTFRVTNTTANPLEIAVFKGEITVHDPESGSDVAVKKNETFALNPADPESYALEKGVDADSLDEWSKQRDDYLSAYAFSGNNGQSPYQYGAGDLYYYGQYYDVPGYGSVWQPNNVGLGWDPFSNGYWNYAPGFGYTWVSSYPWGWLPFRYGHWVFIAGRGWFWAPGGWNRWHRAPVWTNAPPGFRPPARPVGRPAPPADRRVVDGAPGQVIRPGTAVVGGPGSRVPAGRVSDRDGNNAAQVGGKRDNRRVFSNEDLHADVPHVDNPPPQTPPRVERTPVVVEQHQPTEGGGEIHRGEADRFHGNRESRISPAVSTPATPAQPERQFSPPPQPYSPPAQQTQHMSPPSPPAPQPAPQVHQPAPPSPPPAAVAPQRQSDDGSRGRPR
jgi:hypothetical protein